VAVAAGELLLFADADDVVDELWVQEMVRALREHPFVGGRLEFLQLNGERVASWRLPLGEQSLPVMGGRPWAVGSNFGCTAAALAAVGGFREDVVGIAEDVELSMAMHARGITVAFAERAVVHYRYRRRPREVLRQMWAYGRSRKAIYARYGIDPPTFIDTVVRCYRDAKSILRETFRRRLPVGPLGDAAFVLGEASAIWRLPRFWHPVTRIVSLENPVMRLRCRLDRLARLARLARRRSGVR